MKAALRRRAALPAALLLAAIAAAGLLARAQSPAAENLMRKKLDHSKEILEGLALEDFARIQKGAEALAAISRMDQWLKYKSPEYDILSESFRSTAGRMAKAARDKNLEAATLQFVNATMSCVDCHKLIRGGSLVTGIQ